MYTIIKYNKFIKFYCFIVIYCQKEVIVFSSGNHSPSELYLKHPMTSNFHEKSQYKTNGFYIIYLKYIIIINGYILHLKCIKGTSALWDLSELVNNILNHQLLRIPRYSWFKYTDGNDLITPSLYLFYTLI